ncbi:MAG: serine/threonine-protein kinase, partial [Terriglobia bacterium]
MHLAAGDRLGPFEVLECLGNGDESTSFRAIDTTHQFEVALKVLPGELAGDPEWLNRFRLDAELLNSLRHPGIPAIYDVHQFDGITAVALQFVEGASPQPPLPVEDVIRIVLQIAEALKVAHRSGIAHRNLTPASILLTADGGVKVLHFGLARRLGSQSGAPDAPTMTIGADPISPDEFRGVENDYHSDIRAIGELLVHLLGDSEGLPSAVQQAIARASDNDPNRRFASIAEFAALLEQRRATPARERAITVRSFLTLNDDGELPAALSGEARYTDMGLLGAGGMGEVRRVRDRALNRILAMKIVKAEVKGLQGRFVQEARITAQLEHPAIIPVHEIGVLSDGRLYFTMKEVHGQTFSAAIRQAHASWQIPEAFRTNSSRWTLRQLTGLLQRVSAGVGYAHSRGVLHRDLKPSNMMIGAFGEALVLDWGLTSVGSAPASGPDAAADTESIRYEERTAITDSTRTADERTLFGAMMGTPGFMAPEQGTGDLDNIGPQSDVFSLGCVLYNILMGSAPQSVGRTGRIAPKTEETLSAPPLRAGGGHGPLAPKELWEICRVAMAPNPRDRYANASLFAAA